MSRSSATLILLALLIAFLAIGAAFAISTPQWQAPDEPAHYNYIKFIVEHGALPVLQAGDYDQTYNEDFTRTPRDTQIRSIDPLRYENYSPPLYYLLAAPIYAAADGWWVAIRLLSVILGGALIVVAYLIGAELFPTRLEIALGGAAFVAFVPQHVAMLSAVNSDALAELLIALCALSSPAVVPFSSTLSTRAVKPRRDAGPRLIDEIHRVLHRLADRGRGACLAHTSSHSTQYAIRLSLRAGIHPGRAVLASQSRRLRRPGYSRAGAAQRHRRGADDHRRVDRAVWLRQHAVARPDDDVSFPSGDSSVGWRCRCRTAHI